MANSTLKIKRSSTSIAPAVLNTGELAYTFGTGTDANQGGRLFVGGMGTNSDLQSALGAPIVIGGKYFTDMVDAATSVGTNNTIVKRDGTNTAFLNITGNSAGIHTGAVTGNVTGSVTGNVTGDLIGDVYASNGTNKILEAGTNGTDAIFYGSVQGSIAGNAATATTAITVTGSTQTAITSVGTLTGLTVNGAIIGASVGNIIPFYFADQAAFPSAVTYHGAIAHSHADSRMYFAHGGVWNAIANSSDATSLNTASATVARDASGNFTAGTITAALVGNASSVTNGIYSTDTGTVTNAMLAGSIANGKLSNSTVTIGDTVTALGATSTAFTGLTSVTSAAFIGALTGNATTATTLASGRTIAITGDIAYTSPAFNGAGDVTAAATLTTVLDGTLNKVPGAFGSATSIPVVTVDAKGRVTAITTAAVASTLSVAGSTGSAGTLNLLDDTLTIAAGTNVTTSFNNSTDTLTVGLVASPSFTDVTLTGTLAALTVTATGNITATGNLAGQDLAVAGNATITGNLIVNGTTTTVSSTTVTIADRNLQLAPAANSDVGTDGGGLLVGVNGPGNYIAPSLLYTQANGGRWNFNKDLNVANVYGALKGNADTASAWSTAKTIYFATGDVSGNFSTDGSANVSNVALTLANTGVSAASYGDSVTIPNFTVNAKGLLTAASSTAIPNATISVKGLASFDSTQFTVTAGAVAISTVDGGTY